MNHALYVQTNGQLQAMHYSYIPPGGWVYYVIINTEIAAM